MKNYEDDFIIRNKTIKLTLPINVDDETKKFIFKNINMYRRIKNDFIEDANKHFNVYHTYKGYNVFKFKTKYFKKEQEEGRYSEYVRGLSEQVAKEIDTDIKSILAKNEKGEKMGKFKFCKFDKFYGTFTTHLKPCIYKVKNGTNYSSKIKDTPNNEIISFKVRGKQYGDNEEIRHFHLKEPLYDDIIIENNKNHIYVRYFTEDGLKTAHEYRFRGKDIRLITFIHELGHFYIQLTIDATYILYKDIIEDRYEIAGIDTGIHNPAVLYDGIKIKYIRMDEKTISRIKRIECRINYLQNQMSNKYRINKKRVASGELKTPYTKNYEKLHYKLRKSWRRIVNIRRQWCYDECKKIVTTYKHIVVDTFKQPDHSKDDLPIDVLHKINYINRFHCMYTFNETLKHMAEKYGCFYHEAPENSTCICSDCGHKNKPLPLTKRYMVCEKCGLKIDRDVNAAINCYKK